MKVELNFIAPVALIAMVVGLALYTIDGTTDAIIAFVYIAMAFPIALISESMLKRVADAEKARRLDEQIAESLYSMVYYKTKETPMYRILSRVSENAESSDVRSIFREISNRMKLGESFSAAIAFVGNSRGVRILKDFSAGGHSNDYDSIVRVLNSYESAMVEKNTVLDASLQRYATINMFMSTVLPSFVIFIFIGETILAQGSGSMVPLSIVMVLVLPFAYLLGNLLIKRRLVG